MWQKLDYDRDWGSHFQLDDASPSGLVRIRSGWGNKIAPKPVGKKNFSKKGDSQGWQVRFQYKDYCVHRVIWVMAYGSIDDNLVIDHLDGDPLNNLISNLSLKTSADNHRNQRKHFDNTSGVTGVSLVRQCKYYYYVAYWYELDGSPKSKGFSILKFGEENAKARALAYREDQVNRLISEGADYTVRHGT